MYRTLRSALLYVLISVACAHAQRVGTVNATQRLVKGENELIVSWMTGRLNNEQGDQINVFDEQGHPLLGLNVLRLVPDASRVSIYDVAVRPGALIAVAAVYGSKQGNQVVRPAATLLLFDFQGRLLSSFVLQPWREICRMAVDDHSNIWTLTDGADDKNPGDVPMVVEYSPSGTVLKELLPRSMFPLHARHTWEGNGNAVMGYDSGVVWFWLPVSTERVTIAAEDGKWQIVKTQLPKRQGYTETPLRLVGNASHMIAAVREDGEHGQHDLAYYSWLPSKEAWVPFKPGLCQGDFPIGLGKSGQVYIGRSTPADVCLFRLEDVEAH